MSFLHVDSFGAKYWYRDRKRHRDNGPAVECLNGHTEWWINGKLHRLDGPAVEKTDGTKIWFQNDQCHRLDGPAIEWDTGMFAWYLNGIRYHSIDEYCKAANITGAKKTLFLLRWSNKFDQSANGS